jgi:hypothetical protein
MSGIAFEYYDAVFYGPDGIATRMFEFYLNTSFYEEGYLPWATHGSVDAFCAILTTVRTISVLLLPLPLPHFPRWPRPYMNGRMV